MKQFTNGELQTQFICHEKSCDTWNTNLNLYEWDTSKYTKKMDKYVKKWGFETQLTLGFACTILTKHPVFFLHAIAGKKS